MLAHLSDIWWWSDHFIHRQVNMQLFGLQSRVSNLKNKLALFKWTWKKSLTINVCNFFELSLNNKFISKPLIFYLHLQLQKGPASQRYSTASLMCQILEHRSLLLAPIKTSAQSGPSWLENMLHDASQFSAPSYHPLSCLLSASVHFPFKHLTFSGEKKNQC